MTSAASLATDAGNSAPCISVRHPFAAAPRLSPGPTRRVLHALISRCVTTDSAVPSSAFACGLVRIRNKARLPERHECLLHPLVRGTNGKAHQALLLWKLIAGCKERGGREPWGSGAVDPADIRVIQGERKISCKAILEDSSAVPGRLLIAQRWSACKLVGPERVLVYCIRAALRQPNISTVFP